MSPRGTKPAPEAPKVPKSVGWATTVVSMIGASAVTYGLIFLWYLSKK